MRATNTDFYNGSTWRKISKLYLQSKYYICERCGQPATICHHKKYLNDQNKEDYEIAYSFDNLEALCIDCHNKEHFEKDRQVFFDSDGNISRVRESTELEEYKTAQKAVESLLSDFKGTEV